MHACLVAVQAAVLAPLQTLPVTCSRLTPIRCVQLAVSPMRAQTEGVLELLRGLSPGVVRQILPLLDQLTPMYLEVASGRQEFHPSPPEMQALVRSHYGEKLMKEHNHFAARRECACCRQV